ncbi:MAG TPA: BatD family protein [Paludibacter sp.]|nr:BatD family protein [Paludibacter sp.]
MGKFLLFSLSVLLLPVSTLRGQQITVNARLDSTVIWVGNQTRLSFEVTQRPGQKVDMPIFSDTIGGGLEMVEFPQSDTIKSDNGNILVRKKYIVTAFHDSLLYIPPFPFVVGGDTVWSKSLSLKVVQPFQIDTASKSIADIKPVLDPKFDWAGLFKTILLVLTILAILVVLFVFVRKYILKKPVLEKVVPEEIIPPHIVALSKLDKIKQEKAWQSNRSKEYHTELTDVIREYVERVFNIKSMEMTSAEILDNLRIPLHSQKSAYQGLKQILQLADLVKFAKWNPGPDEHELSLVNAYLFVNQTKVEEVKPLDELRNEELKPAK